MRWLDWVIAHLYYMWCMNVWARDLFFITRTLSLEAVVKEESMNYPSGTTGPCHKRRGEGKWRGEKGSIALLIVVGLRDWKDARRMCLPLLVIRQRCRLSLCPVNWNTKQSRVDERAAVRRKRRRKVGGGGGKLLSVYSNTQPSLLAGNWLWNQQARPTHCHW